MTADPGVALLLFGVMVGVVLLLLWPRRGLVPRVSRLMLLTERVRIEDSLKHLYNCQYLGRRGTVESLAGALEVSRARAVKLAAHLEALRLARSDGEELPLTDAGQAYALRVLRTHRLWERYLADRTDLKPADWHDDAELREHTLTAAETEELAARIGHPLYDPHGDPIPTVSGELPEHSGVPLTSLKTGQSGAIIHLEDEPREVYQQLVAASLAPLMRVQLLDATPERIQFTADGQEHSLEPVVAASITVAPLPQVQPPGGPCENLAALQPGESATVVRIAPACQGPQRRRLLDLGVVPGTVVSAELEGAMNGPVAYRIRGALIALRKQQAEWIDIDRDRPETGD